LRDHTAPESRLLPIGARRETFFSASYAPLHLLPTAEYPKLSAFFCSRAGSASSRHLRGSSVLVDDRAPRRHLPPLAVSGCPVHMCTVYAAWSISAQYTGIPNSTITPSWCLYRTVPDGMCEYILTQ
jgi:hypothetical protein